jgi:hypothetical protein
MLRAMMMPRTMMTFSENVLLLRRVDLLAILFLSLGVGAFRETPPSLNSAGEYSTKLARP